MEKVFSKISLLTAAFFVFAVVSCGGSATSPGTSDAQKSDSLKKDVQEEETESLTMTLPAEQRYEIAKKYDDMDYLYNGLAWVKRSGKYGFIDKEGKEVIPCVYDGAFGFSDGVAAVKQGYKWGFIDKTGKEVVPFVYTDARKHSEGLACVEKDGKWGFIDKEGKEVVPCKYAYAKDFSEGLAVVAQDTEYGLKGFIDKTGKIVIPIAYKYANSFSEGLAPVVVQDGVCVYIDKKGKAVMSFNVDGASSFINGYAQLVEIEPDGFGGNRYMTGFIDKNGTVVGELFDCGSNRVVFFNDGFMVVYNNSYYLYDPKEGRLIAHLPDSRLVAPDAMRLFYTNAGLYNLNGEQIVTSSIDFDNSAILGAAGVFCSSGNYYDITDGSYLGSN